MNEHELILGYTHYISDKVPGMIAIYNSQTGAYVYVNNTIRKILGFEPKDFINGGMEFVSHLVHPEDEPKIMAQNLEALAKANDPSIYSTDSDPIASFEYRMRHKDGHWLWIRTDGTVFDRDENGKVKHVMNISFDITQQKESEEIIRMQSHLRAAKDELEMIFNNVADGISVQDKSGEVVFANSAALKFLGCDCLAEIRATPAAEITSRFELFDEKGNSISAVSLPGRLALQGIPNNEITLRWKRKTDGAEGWSEIKANPVFNQDGSVKFAINIWRDVTKEKLMREEFERSNRRNQHILESITDGFFALDNDWRFTYVNKQAENLFFDKTREELLGKNILEVFPNALESESYKKVLDAIDADQALRYEEYFPESGKWIEISAYPAKDGLSVYLREITAQKKSEERLRHQYYHDMLTGLPNRIYLSEQLAQALIDANRSTKSAGLALIDLDRFKQVNESLGHAVGDRLIQEVALRLRSCVRENQVVARLGGDEFAILLPDIETEEEVARISNKILDDFKPPFFVDDYELFISPSIGISLYPYDGREAATLMKNAEAALYRAKEHGRNTYQFYTTAMNATAYERLTMESKLRRAIDNNELVLFYQPQIDVTNGKIIGAEALMRWQRPDSTFIPPDRFIPLAEANGLIEVIGEMALRHALAQAKIWHDAGFRLMIAVNLSARQFKQKNFESIVVNLIESSGLDPKFIELELTESVLAENSETIFEIMNALRQKGVRFCLDDFSTGYSSLKYIKQFPVDMLKIERNFLRGIPNDVQNSAIAKSIITLGQSLGLEVTAEGVESKKQLEFLRNHMCNRAQGYLFNGAMPAHSLSEILSEDRYVSVVESLKTAKRV